MRLRDVKNPAEAKAAIEALQKRFKEKRCLAPDTTQCAGGIISAHTLSAEAMLRPISRNGHVYAISVNHFAESEDRIFEYKLKGIRDTSVFNGFCSHHDKQLFLEIEDRPFVCSHHQIFLHAFRAVAKESYLKRRQAEMTPTVDQYRKIHGISDQLEPSPELIMHQVASLQGADELDRFKQLMDQIYISRDWGRLVTTVIQLDRTPDVVCNFVYSPDFDFEGKELQDFHDFSKDLDHLMVTITPSKTGGFAFLSHIDTAGPSCDRLIRSLISMPNVSTALIWLAFGQSENIAMAPDWFEKLSKAQASLLRHHFESNSNPFIPEINRLRLCPEFIADWSVRNIFKI